MFGRTLIALTACGALAGTAMAEDQKAEGDVVFKALADELARAKTLSMYKVDKPYYLHAFANDGDSFAVAASFGALTRKGGAPNRSLLVDLRVGTPELDNKNFSGGGFGRFGGRGGMFRGRAPQEADYDAIRQNLWTQFDSSFKSAAETIAKKRAYLETNNVQDRQPDFGPAPVVDMVLPRQTLQVDRDKWTALTKKVSAVFRQHDYVYSCSASFSRYRCTACSKTFSANTGTIYERLHCSRDEFDRVVQLSVEGMNKSAIARVTRRAWNTIARWLALASEAARQFNDRMIRGFELKELQADGQRPKAPKGPAPE